MTVNEMAIRVMTLPGRVAVSSDNSEEGSYYITTKGNYWKGEGKDIVEEDTRKILGLILDHPTLKGVLKLIITANYGPGINIPFKVQISYDEVREIALKLSQ